MDGVPLLRLCQAELQTLALEVVAAVLDPVGPGEQQLAAPSRAHLVSRVAGHHVIPVSSEAAETGPHFDDLGFVGAGA
jgi:hypothetical protein